MDAKKEDDRSYMETTWTNGNYTLRWINVDEVEITGPYHQRAVLCGGDFESVLSALCAASATATRAARKALLGGGQ